jgi:PAS domain S-box-containing protein
MRPYSDAGPGASPDHALARAAEETAELAAALGDWPAAVVQVDGVPAPRAASVGMAADERDGALDLARALLRRDGAAAVADARGEPALQAAGWTSAAAVPVIVGGQPRGVLTVLDRRPRPDAAAALPRLAMLARGLAARFELTLREEQFERLAANVPGVLYQFRVTPEGHMSFPYASAGLRQIYRVDPEDVREDASITIPLGHPEDVERVLESIAVSARDLTPWDCEYRVRFADGTEQWLHGRAAPERLADGSTLWHGFIMPIDARKQAELALARSEESFRHFFEAGLVGMTIAEPGRRWLNVNRRMGELLGYTPEEMRSLDWADFTHPEDLPADEAEYARMMAGEIDGYVMNKRYRRKDGSVLECALAVRCERDAQGAVQRVFAIVEDISERRRAERALERQRDRLELEVRSRTRELVLARDVAQQANRAKTEFLASMSHELRTPLNAILGFAQLIDLDRDLGARSRGHLVEVLRAGRHLLRLINEVLDLAQVESGRLAMSPEPLRLADLVEEARALATPLAEGQAIALETAVPPDLIVRADRTRLKQVLLNLVSNAVKYNRAGGWVRVSAEPLDGDRLRLTVADSGQGIAADRQAELFQPFNRLGAEFGTTEGTGIGLALSRRLVEMMGGEVGVESTPGVGSRFWLDLPQGRLAEPPAEPVAGAAATPPAMPRATVLYVEDNPANLALVEQILARHAGVEMLSATTGRAGLELARARQPALILLDIHLPEMDGYEVLARLRADEALRHVPVVALTAQAMPRDVRRALQAGFDEHLAKPIDIPVFDALLRRLLAERRP